MTAAAVTDLYAVVPAAGSGSRMQRDKPKQYINIDGQSVLRLTLNKLLQITPLTNIVIVHDEASSELVESYVAIDSDRISSCKGGVNRAESVRNGLQHLHDKYGPVCQRSSTLVHDAARPCVRISDIARLIELVAEDEHGGLLAVKLTDTILRANDQDQVIESVDRDLLWRAATPQLFNTGKLLDALNTALQDGVTVTDEASAMQRAGYKPKLVECHADNIKITTESDLVLAQLYLADQASEE